MYHVSGTCTTNLPVGHIVSKVAINNHEVRSLALILIASTTFNMSGLKASVFETSGLVVDLNDVHADWWMRLVSTLIGGPD